MVIQDTIERQIILRATKERVFDAITRPDQIIRWFPDQVEGKIEPGESPILDFGEYGKSSIYIVAVDPYDYFAYKWIPMGDVGDILGREHTLVEFRLEESPGGTVVKLKESGFSSLPIDTKEKQFTENTDGWAYMFDRLEKLFAED